MRGPASITLTFKINKTKQHRPVSKNEADTEVFTIKWYPDLHSGGTPMMANALCIENPPESAFIKSRDILKTRPKADILDTLASISLTSYNHISSFRRKTWNGIDEDLQAALNTLFNFDCQHKVSICFLDPWGTDFAELGSNVRSLLQMDDIFNQAS